MQEKKIIMYDSDEAAKLITKTIKTWKDSTGFCWSESDEHAARWAGCTHKKCECGKIITKHLTMCNDCGKKENRKRYKKRSGEVWDKKGMVYSDVEDKFFEYDELIDYMYDESLTPEDLDLLLCEEQKGDTVDGDDYYCDKLAEDGEVPTELQEIFDEANAKIKALDITLSWYATDVAAIIELTEEEKEKLFTK